MTSSKDYIARQHYEIESEPGLSVTEIEHTIRIETAPCIKPEPGVNPQVLIKPILIAPSPSMETDIFRKPFCLKEEERYNDCGALQIIDTKKEIIDWTLNSSVCLSTSIKLEHDTPSQSEEFGVKSIQSEEMAPNLFMDREGFDDSALDKKPNENSVFQLTKPATDSPCLSSEDKKTLAADSPCLSPENKTIPGVSTALNQKHGVKNPRTRNIRDKSELNRPKYKRKRQAHFKCNVCGKNFGSKDGLTKHSFTHTGEKPFKCAVCGKGFTQSANKERHMRIHTGEKPFKCGVCGKDFCQSGDRKTHEQGHSGEKPYQCTVCGKSFGRPDVLNKHLRIHTGEKPFKCDVCEKSFTRRFTFVTHQRTHTGERPYKCAICENGFAQLSSLNSHMHTHTGDKPYSCEICGTGFAHRGSLANHKTSHSCTKS